VRDAAFYQTLFQDQFTLAGLALATLGIVGLWRRPREGVLILGALALQLAFAFNYRTADVEVHFLTTFLLGAMLLGAGTDALFSIANGRLPLFRSLATLLLCLIPIHLLNAILQRTIYRASGKCTITAWKFWRNPLRTMQR
jgi:uncharacterized membrane protein